MSNTTAKNGSTFIVNTDDVGQVGGYIITEASELIGAAEPNTQYTLYNFQQTFTHQILPKFPDAFKGTFGTFIQNQHDGYQDILLNRESIGIMLQNKVAADTEEADFQTQQQFQEQLKNIQQESW